MYHRGMRDNGQDELRDDTLVTYSFLFYVFTNETFVNYLLCVRHYSALRDNGGMKIA